MYKKTLISLLYCISVIIPSLHATQEPDSIHYRQKFPSHSQNTEEVPHQQNRKPPSTTEEVNKQSYQIPSSFPFNHEIRKFIEQFGIKIPEPEKELTDPKRKNIGVNTSLSIIQEMKQKRYKKETPNQLDQISNKSFGFKYSTVTEFSFSSTSETNTTPHYRAKGDIFSCPSISSFSEDIPIKFKKRCTIS